ncbi:MAG TPA: pyridoxal phosphate-dependent aminotransferase [Thermoanaerobaculia bacterium]|nr:pyridoxal phosphate-dependent aminotransferase [Thermoanaerobaculia bacterium]
MQLSRRVARIRESATLRVARRALELRAQGVHVVDFGAGEPDFASPRVAVEAARQALADGFTKYTANNGIPELRRALAERYRRDFGSPWTAAETLVTVGGKGGLFESTLALVDDGSEVVLHTPAWVSFVEQIRFAGGVPVEVPTDGADAFAIRAEPILAALTDRTRAVILNSPCNPTGGVIRPEERRAIVEECARRGIVVLSDETYERFVYDGFVPGSVAELAAEFPDTVALVGSFSKTYAMTGWRIGYLLGPRELVDAAARIQSHSTSNATSFAMKGALAALDGAETEVVAMICEYAWRRRYLIDRLNAIPGIHCAAPRGAFYAFPDVSARLRDDGAGATPTELAERLLDLEAVAIVAGEAFGSDRHVRISFACSRADLAEGLDRIERFLARSRVRAGVP